MTGAIRIQKFLSRAGRASRREAERLVEAGRIRVNGRVVEELGARVVPGRDRIELDGEPVALPDVVWLAFHKPAGVLTTRRDPHGGRTVYDLLPDPVRHLRYVGRLDRDTEGLLLLTNDGDALHGLTHPSREVEREYVATVEVAPGLAALRSLETGVELDDGPARARRVELGGRTERGRAVRVVLTEGRKREVRRMLDRVGHPVVRLIRVRFGPVTLGDLPSGRWRELDGEERDRLERAARGAP